ncbi:MAG TPA: hypothetical protein VHZ33_25865 [Trebonia sp.]|jgi:hypothetical protein|nr:hypothetical protein [Trebonia sp.]
MRNHGFTAPLRRIFVCVLSIASLALLAAVSSGSQARAAIGSQPKGNCSAKQISQGVNGICLLSNVYSGYTAQLPSGHWALGVTGTWIVPKISCPGDILEGNPRTAVWVGQFGSWTDLVDKSQKGKADAWLPQIGTLSRCLAGKAVYSIAWEMAADQTGYGNAAQDSLDCPGNKIYKLCSYTDFPSHPGKKMTIRPGDHVLASVGILTGNQPAPGAKAQPRKFQIYLDDMTTGVIADGSIETAKGASPVKVGLAQIIDQSGVIVEDEPGVPAFNGLAKFDSPIRITAYIAQWKQYRTTVNEWFLQRDYLKLVHHQLAQNGRPSGSMTGSSGMSWTVTWLRQY